MATISAQEFLRGGKKPILVQSAGQPPESTSTTAVPFGQKAKEFGVGLAKGFGATVQGLQDLGQRAAAAVDPTLSLEEVRKVTGSKALAEADFDAKTPYEKAGKVTEFFAEALFPVGKTGALETGGKVAVGSLDNLAEKASMISDDLVEGGVKVKDKIISLSNSLDEKTKTALLRTPKDVFDNVVETGKKAMGDDRAVTPIEAVGQRFIEGAKIVKNKLDGIGAQKQVVLDQAKNAQQDVSDLVKKAVLDIRRNAKGLGPEDSRFVAETIERLMPYTKNGRLKAVDALIDDLQNNLYKLSDSEKAVQLTDRVTGIVRNAVEGMNRELQTRVGGNYAKLNQQYSQLIKVIDDVNRGVGRKGERAGSFMKRFFSPSDAGTKKLFENMEKLTGIDFARDARLAKFVMESLGDRRAEALLEQIPQNMPQGAVDAAVKTLSFIAEKMGIRDPLEAARVFIEKHGDSLTSGGK